VTGLGVSTSGAEKWFRLRLAAPLAVTHTTVRNVRCRSVALKQMEAHRSTLSLETGQREPIQQRWVDTTTPCGIRSRTRRPSCSTRLGRSALRALCRGRGPCRAPILIYTARTRQCLRCCATCVPWRPDCSQRTASTVLHGHCSPRRRPPHHVIDPTTPGHCLAHCRLPSVRSLARTHAHAGVARHCRRRRCDGEALQSEAPLRRLIFTRAVRPSEQRRPGGSTVYAPDDRRRVRVARGKQRVVGSERDGADNVAMAAEGAEAPDQCAQPSRCQLRSRSGDCEAANPRETRRE
jgi:hypothetical protein